MHGDQTGADQDREDDGELFEGQRPGRAPDLREQAGKEEIVADEPKQRAKEALPAGDTQEENEVIQLLGRGLRNGFEIVKESNWLDAASFNRAITLLEIKGVVKGLGNNQWVLVSR